MFLEKETNPSQKQHLNGKGKRSRGRPRETWRRTIEGDLKKMGKTWKEVEKIAANRNKWRGLVSALGANGCEEDY